MQFLHQTQLMDRLQHEEVQGKVQLEQSQLELQEAQVSRASELVHHLPTQIIRCKDSLLFIKKKSIVH